VPVPASVVCGMGGSVLMAAVDFALGMVRVAVHRWVCDLCGRPVRYLTKRQHRQWRERRPVECRGLLPFRRVCEGHLVPAEAVAR
jgi:hypothetical protein